MSEDQRPAYVPLHQGDLDAWEQRLRTMKRRQVALFVFVLVAITVLASLTASLRQQKCGDAFAAAEYAAQTPIDVAQTKLNSADATIWEATQQILTQQAGPDDYRRLRARIRHRNWLWDDLVAEQKANPIPLPPDEFC